MAGRGDGSELPSELWLRTQNMGVAFGNSEQKGSTAVLALSTFIPANSDLKTVVEFEWKEVTRKTWNNTVFTTDVYNSP